MDNTTQQPLYHHYLPSFYQARWAGEDGKLRRFSVPIENKIVAKWVSPEVSGGEDLLYTDHAAPADTAQALESGFMSPLDSLASQALVALEANDPILRRDSRLRSAWSRFLMSLMMRMPDHLETLSGGLVEEWARMMPELETAYASGRGSTDPETFAEYLESRSPEEIRSWMISVLRRLMDHSQIGALINNMRWFVRHIDGPAQFLTSDRPIITWYEFAAEDSYIILPIGPKAAFVAVNNLATQRRIEAYDAEKWVGGLNSLIAGAAVKFVFARDDEMRPLIERNFGSRPRTTLFQYLVRYRRQKNTG
ncbi:DUF4238 domain-containing protein [Rhizobium leguminosarum bv. viciae]|uniref:DUF4238 domain-containing protein n=1 Tax=Rhizobium leguminosarum TaxID=384 RepID=UPI001441873D|nr:DUF4238 domain-containing protein [Rhizobium leguminosarum]NKK96532.1 DUF4238 domain-containing protein [Rhizobium leguminosarum bv. viciae]